METIPLALQAPNTTLTIRPVQLTDTDGLVAHCWTERSFMAVHNLTRRAIRYAAERRGLGLVGIGSDGEICAYGQTVMWPTCAEISDLIVAEAYRGQGVGTAIIQSLVQTVLRMGADDIEIGAALNNPRAIALYRRLGFVDSHTVMLNLDHGKEEVLFLRLNLLEKQPHAEEE